MRSTLRELATPARRRAAVWLIALGVLAYLFTNAQSDRDALRREATVRTQQFCHVNTGKALEHVKQYDSTIRFLAAKAGRADTALNDFIRAQLPKQRADVVSELELVPPPCRNAETNAALERFHNGT